MKSSFNVYGTSRTDLGNPAIPVWLGTVEPQPGGHSLNRDYLIKGALYPQGCPIYFTDKVFTPFIALEVSAVEDGVLTVDFGRFGFAPTTSYYVQAIGDDLSSLGSAVAITAVEATDAEGVYKITAAVTVEAGGAIVLSPTSEGAPVPNAYLYNDIYIGHNVDVTSEDTSASGAVVVYHHSGFYVDRTPSGVIKAQMKALVPGVYQQND